MAKEWFVLHILHVPKCALLKIPEVKCTTYRRFETFGEIYRSHVFDMGIMLLIEEIQVFGRNAITILICVCVFNYLF